MTLHAPASLQGEGEKSFVHYAGQLAQALVAVLQLIRLLHGSVEYNCKHGHVCFWQTHVLNGFPGEKSFCWPDVMGTSLKMQTVKVKIKISLLIEFRQQQRHKHFVGGINCHNPINSQCMQSKHL